MFFQEVEKRKNENIAADREKEKEGNSREEKEIYAQETLLKERRSNNAEKGRDFSHRASPGIEEAGGEFTPCPFSDY